MSRARLYIHPLCPSSYSVLKKLWSKVGGPGALEIVSVDRRPKAVLTHGVVSTPWLEVGGVAMAADPMEPELAVCLLYTSPSPRDLSTSRMPSSA